jgi:hypothetical protein
MDLSMDAQMTLPNSAVDSADTRGFDGRKAAIMRDGALPDAPFIMPRQVIETPHKPIADTVLHGARRLYVLMAQGFGPTARGR